MVLFNIQTCKFDEFHPVHVGLAWHKPLHILSAIHFPGHKILPRFAKILYFSSLCVKFQPSECIISINFDHFASSFNYVRGVMAPAHPHATSIAVYPALLFNTQENKIDWRKLKLGKTVEETELKKDVGTSQKR